MKLSQIFAVSLHSLKSNKLRTFLTILGIVVGIFSIIVIMTVITMLQSSIENGVAFLSKNTFQINKFPAIHSGGPGSWQKYRNRKDITIEDFERLRGVMKQAKYIGAEQSVGGRVIKSVVAKTNPNISVIGVTIEAYMTHNVTIAEGRSLNELDVDHSTYCCLLGNSVTTKIFPNINPIGQIIKVDGFPIQVVGTFEPQPALFGQNMDSYIIIPITTYGAMYGKNNRSVSITIMSKSKEDYNATIEAAIGYFRTIRKVPPGVDNDFDIFSNESIMGQINDITGGVKIGAIVVSIIALLAAGVGIMNIMLVSVTERTREIGVRKAVGARKMNILLQFLMEAIALCIIGGIIGIFLGVVVGNIAGSFLNAQSAIPVDWIVIGMALCIVVGVIFGTYPAYKAANLDPIEALRYE
jgi:putative ABC transport system permease protein